MPNPEGSALTVGDEYRTHPWSFRPGGTLAMVQLKSKTIPLIYPRVKDPRSYVDSVVHNNGDDLIAVWILSNEIEWDIVWYQGLYINKPKPKKLRFDKF